MRKVNKPSVMGKIFPKKQTFTRKSHAIMMGPVGDTVQAQKTKRKQSRIKVKQKRRGLSTTYLKGLMTQKLLFLLLTVLMCGLGYIFAISTDVFDLKQDALRVTSVTGSSFDLDIAYAQIGSLVGRKTLFISSQEVFDLLHPSFPHLRSVKTSVRFPDGFFVQLDAYPPVFQTQIDDTVYTVMQNGSIVGARSLDSLDVPFLQIVGAPDGIDPKQGFLLSFSEVQKISYLFSYLQKYADTFPRVHGFLYYYAENEIHVIGDTRLLLSFDVDFVDILDSLREIEAQLSLGYISERFTYLDLRVADRMYACPARELISCQEYLAQMYGDGWDADWGAPRSQEEDEEV